jgi:uncharacterized membrane protein
MDGIRHSRVVDGSNRILAGAGAEFLALATGRTTWRAVSVANVRAGAAMAIVTAIAGWRLASSPFAEPTRSLTLHTWVGLAAAGAASAAALISMQPRVQSRRLLVAYEAALLVAAAFVGIAGHLGAALVWGHDFLWR